MAYQTRNRFGSACLASCIWRCANMSLGAMLLRASPLWAARTRRTASFDQAKTVFRLHDAGRFTVSQSHVESLCHQDVVREASYLLDAHPDTDQGATAQSLAEMVAAEESEVLDLLVALGIGAKGNFDCRALCAAAVNHIPAILHMAPPPKPQVGCIDDACLEKTVDLSEEALAEEYVESHPKPFHNADVVSEIQPGPTIRLSPEVRGQEIFRTVLAVIFKIFPAADAHGIGDSIKSHDSSVTAMLQRSNDTAPGVDVKFSHWTYPERHDNYRIYMAKAVGWIAAALRKLKNSNRVAAKWFILDESDSAAMAKQIKESRKHMTKMMDALAANVYIERGLHAKGLGPLDMCGGVLAFVRAIPFCTIKSPFSCGWKTPGGRHIIYICDDFWHPETDIHERVGTLVHEVSHVFGTDDKGYCDRVDCLALTSRDARRNADTYWAFIRELAMPNQNANATSNHVTPTEPTTHPHAPMQAPRAYLPFQATRAYPPWHGRT